MYSVNSKNDNDKCSKNYLENIFKKSFYFFFQNHKYFFKYVYIFFVYSYYSKSYNKIVLSNLIVILLWMKKILFSIFSCICFVV